MQRIPVMILGATGMVGQRLVERLVDHPWFEPTALAASERSAGRPYGEACAWRLPGALHAGLGGREVLPCDPAAAPPGVRVVLSALDSSVAGEIEASFRAAGFAVVSNASNFRQDPEVPLVIPEVNPEHLSLVEGQRRRHGGYIVTNPNCCSIPLAMALAPLHRAWGVQALVASTWQAVSGAGYPGESAWDMVGNVHPHPGNEEAKLAVEPQKILGSARTPADFVLSARCVRVPTADGHLISAQVRLAGDPPPEAVTEAMAGWRSPVPGLPSSPNPLLHLHTLRDRPSPRFDADNGGGMAVTVGRIEACAVMGVKFYCLAHNTVRGAAGAAIANLELLRLRGLLPAG
jgi:aspartate-semialdehyde dehydrogenase